MKRYLIAGAYVCVATLWVQAADPSWWTAPDTRIISPTAPENNFAPVTVGQLKHVAQQAAEHLESSLEAIGGAGPVISQLVSQFEPRAGVAYTPEQLAVIASNNRSPANLGQLKNVAKPFYDRLMAIGYDTKANLIARQYPANWPHHYPWVPETLQQENYVPANLGQLKMIFSFSLAGFNTAFVDSDADGLRDEWEVDHGLNPNDATDDHGAYGDLDNDGVTNADEFAGGTDPSGPPPDPLDVDGDGMVDSSEGVLPRLSKIVGRKDHPAPQLRIVLQD